MKKKYLIINKIDIEFTVIQEIETDDIKGFISIFREQNPLDEIKIYEIKEKIYDYSPNKA